MIKFLLLLILFSFSLSLSAQMKDSVYFYNLYGESETYNEAMFQNYLVGQSMPVFTAVDMGGNEITPETLDSKVIMIHFWFLSCVGCLKENPVMNQIWDSLSMHNDFAMIAFSYDSRNDMQKFIERDSAYFGPKWMTYKKHPILKFPIVPDCSPYYTLFREWAYPSTIIIDKHGVIRNIVHAHELELEGNELRDYLLSEIQLLLIEAN